MSTFYSEFYDNSRERVMAAAMALHPRLGNVSRLHMMGTDILRHIEEWVPREPLPQLQIMDGDISEERESGIFAGNFDPHQPEEIDPELLLHITVSLPDHHSETIFSGHVLPKRNGGTLRVKTPSSKEGYYHQVLINRHDDSKFELNVLWTNGDSIQMYCMQKQSINEENKMIKQETPQGLCVEIIAPGQAVWPVWEWPMDDQSEFLYSDNQLDLFPYDQRFEFSLFLAGREVFRVPVVDPANPNRTIGCEHIDDEGFVNVASVMYTRDNSGYFLYLFVKRYDDDFQKPTKVDYCIQHLYLDDPKPQQRMQQDLLSGYLSFRVERVF